MSERVCVCVCMGEGRESEEIDSHFWQVGAGRKFSRMFYGCNSPKCKRITVSSEDKMPARVRRRDRDKFNGTTFLLYSKTSRRLPFLTFVCPFISARKFFIYYIIPIVKQTQGYNRVFLFLSHNQLSRLINLWSFSLYKSVLKSTRN